MSLKKETIKTIADKLKIKEADLEAAIKADTEVDVPIDEKLTVLSEEEVTTLKGNSYNDGKKAGVEMEVDKIKKEKSLDFTGKTINGLLEAVSKKAVEDAKIEPDQKVKELETKLQTVQATAQELQTKLAEKEGEITSIKTEGLLVKDMPENLTMPGTKLLLLMKADGYEYKVEEGKVVWHKDGKPLTDKLGTNIPTKDVISEYATENKFIGEADVHEGRRGRDKKNKPVKFTKLSELKADFMKQQKSLLGEEFSSAVSEAAKAEGFQMDA